jgi:hypothetical protein
MRAVETAIEITAPPWRVWRVLTDFAACPAWNPFLTRVQGRPEEGALLRVRVELPGWGSALVLSARVVAIETGRMLRWGSRLLRLLGLLDGEHAFELEWLAGGRATCLRHTARLSGLLAPFVESGDMLHSARRGAEAMAASLKAEAERARAGAVRADA